MTNNSHAFTLWTESGHRRRIVRRWVGPAVAHMHELRKLGTERTYHMPDSGEPIAVSFAALPVLYVFTNVFPSRTFPYELSRYEIR